jgi:hypothetical protein
LSVDNVMASVEVINSKKVTVHVKELYPLFNLLTFIMYSLKQFIIERTEGVQLYLND